MRKKFTILLILFAVCMAYSAYKIYVLKIKYVEQVNKVSYVEDRIIDLSYFYSGDKMQRSRNINKINEATIHHSASMNDNSIRDLYDFQHDKFIKIGVCYHFVIRKNGDIIKCHKLDELVSHAPNANTSGIGICVDGNFDIEEPTQKQVESLKWLIDYLKETFNITTIRGHQDVPGNATACPGKNLEKIINNYE